MQSAILPSSSEKRVRVSEVNFDEDDQSDGHGERGGHSLTPSKERREEEKGSGRTGRGNEGRNVSHFYASSSSLFASELGFHLQRRSGFFYRPSAYVRQSPFGRRGGRRDLSLTRSLNHSLFGGLDIAKCEHRCVDDGCGRGRLCVVAVAQLASERLEYFFSLQPRQHEFSPTLPTSPSEL